MNSLLQQAPEMLSQDYISDVISASTVPPLLLSMITTLHQFSMQENLLSQFLALILKSDSLFYHVNDGQESRFDHNGLASEQSLSAFPMVTGPIYTLITSDAANIVYLLSIVAIFLVSAYISWATWKITFYTLIWMGF